MQTAMICYGYSNLGCYLPKQLSSVSTLNEIIKDAVSILKYFVVEWGEVATDKGPKMDCRKWVEIEGEMNLGNK